MSRGDPPLHPLFRRLFELGFVELATPEEVDAFAAVPGDGVLFFSDEPSRLPEALDLAVILPELAGAFAGQLRVGVLLAAAAHRLALRYGVRRWPALVFLRDGGYVGSIEGLRDWKEYRAETARLLAAPVGEPPPFRIDAGGCPPAAPTA